MKSSLSWSKCIINSDFLALYVGKHYIDVGQEFKGYDDSGLDFMKYGRNVITHCLLILFFNILFRSLFVD